jgi:4-hydroxy-tetrahydrodipicolinate reductase
MRLAVHGAGGQLGSLVMELAGDAAAIPRGGAVPRCGVVLDVSSAEGLSDLVGRLDSQPLLVGTTGALPWAELEAYAARAPVAVVPNFSIGIPLLSELVQKAVQALPAGWDIEIVEAHHNRKRDAPSGTAKRLAQAVEDAGGGVPPMHSIRAGDIFGEHSVWMCGPGERIELRHVATGRKVFAIGAIRWAEWLATQPPGLHRP